jgi:hypothetical protein
MNGFRYPIGPPFGAFPPIVPPFGARFAADVTDNGAYPPMTPEDLAALGAEGMLPPEFWLGPSVEEMGRQSAKILKSDFDMGVTRPEMPQEVISARGQVGDTFRTAQPMNLGRGVPLSAGDTRVLIVEARGLDCLTPVGVTLGYDIPEGEASLIATDEIFIQATIEYGVGGATYYATVDVGRGTQIRLPAATFIRVYYNYTPDQNTSPPRTGPNIVGIALLGYGTPSFRSSPARFTQRVKSVTGSGGTSSIFAIPKSASSYTVIGETASIAGWTVKQFPNLVPDGASHTVFQTLADGQMESAYPIPEGMTAMQLTNMTSTAQRVAVVFTVML